MLLVEGDDDEVSVVLAKELEASSFVGRPAEGVVSLGESLTVVASETALAEIDSSVVEVLAAAPSADAAGDDDGVFDVFCSVWLALDAEVCDALVGVAVGVFITMSSKATLQLSTMAVFVFPWETRLPAMPPNE